MLILRRKEGQWLEIQHRSGDTIRVRVCNIRARYPGQLDLALEDPAHNFLIHRPERVLRPEGHCQCDGNGAEVSALASPAPAPEASRALTGPSSGSC